MPQHSFRNVNGPKRKLVVCSKTSQAYCNIARWEGPLGKFTYLKQMGGSEYGVKNGDVVKATMK